MTRDQILDSLREIIEAMDRGNGMPPTVLSHWGFNDRTPCSVKSRVFNAAEAAHTQCALWASRLQVIRENLYCAPAVSNRNNQGAKGVDSDSNQRQGADVGTE